ncbi:amino acid ABC transporter permease [Paenarthrobacter sp. NPDC057981]|uniref:amino acid ABC transporter permease n=1 Tax=Paenarthrobacter sp. NPDC057981 TaxID=3346297 RepID=UPI0036DEAE59
MNNYQWDFDVVLNAVPLILNGSLYTLLLTLLVFVGSVILGLVLCVLRSANVRPISWLTVGIVDLLRLTPVLVQILWIYYCLPLIGITLTPFWSGVVALAINGAAFTSEIFRAGFGSVDTGVREAAEATGMNRWQVFHRIMLPLAARNVRHPLGTTWVSTFQDTSLVAVLGVTELLHSAQVISTETLRPVEAFTVIGVVYFLLAYPQARLVESLQRRARILT